jgi:hypothetical protein
MKEPTFEKLVERLSDCLAAPGPRPGLLFGQDDLAKLRQRTAAHSDLRDGILRRAREIVAAKDLSTEPEPYYSSLPLLETLTAAYMLEPSADIAAHTVALLRAVAEAPT